MALAGVFNALWDLWAKIEQKVRAMKYYYFYFLLTNIYLCFSASMEITCRYAAY